MALAQAATAEAAGITVLRPPPTDRDDPEAIASALGDTAREAIQSGRFTTVVVVGGDTAAAVLGDRVVVVGGTVAPGVAWSRAWGDDGPLLRHQAGRVRHALDHRRPRQRSATVSAAPPMAITMGDTSGVGPEIVLRTAATGGLDDRIVVYGDASILFSGQRLLGTSVPIRAIEMPGDLVPGDLNVIDLRMLRPSQHRPGELSAEAGAAARAYVERATIDALQGRVAGLVTMPMNKEATQLSDPRFVGHTEMIAELCGAPGSR